MSKNRHGLVGKEAGFASPSPASIFSKFKIARLAALRKTVGLAALASVIAVTTGCPSREVSKIIPQVVRENQQLIPFEINRDVDLLFVVDDSNSMFEEQVSLTQNFSRFIDILSSIDGGAPNMHIGVISTDMAAGTYTGPGCNSSDEGNLLGPCSHSDDNVACSEICDNAETDDGKPYLIDILNDDGTARIDNYSGNGHTLTENFQCRATRGVGGCGLEQPLKSLRTALDANPNNEGFIRENAFLGIIIITDEDDCSASSDAIFDPSRTDLGPFDQYGYRCFRHGVQCDPDTVNSAGEKTDCTPRDSSEFLHNVQSRYVDFIKDLKDDEGKILVATISGRLNEDSVRVIGHPEDGPESLELAASCEFTDSEGNTSEADPPVRVNAFTSSFRENSIHEICQSDLSEAIEAIAEKFALTIGTKCIPRDIVYRNDVPQCTVKDVIHPGEDDEIATPLPRCSSEANSAAEAPCWYFTPDDSCDGFVGDALIIARPDGNSPPVDSSLDFRCEINASGS